MATPISDALFERAQLSIPGGVNSPVRAWRGVGGTPRFIARGEEAHIFDVDGNEYIDYIGSWGPLLLGHRHPVVLDAIGKALARGASFGAPTEQEVELAEAVKRLVPSMEMVRLVNSGTEAGMSVLRVARGFTGRDLTIKFEGCYHGHTDSLLVKAGSGVATLGLPDSPTAGTVVLLSPSVSPTYDLAPPLSKIAGKLHVFHSDQDTFFLSWRTSTFGTYDNVKTKAAGNVGFDLTPLPPELRAKVTQRPREDWWPNQGNDGSHFGTTAREFVTNTVGPLLLR